MGESEFRPPFEAEFPDKDHPERNTIDNEFENGPGNSITAGYVHDRGSYAGVGVNDQPQLESVSGSNGSEVRSEASKTRSQQAASTPKRSKGRPPTQKEIARGDAGRYKAEAEYDGKYK